MSEELHYWLLCDNCIERGGVPAIEIREWHTIYANHTARKQMTIHVCGHVTKGVMIQTPMK